MSTEAHARIVSIDVRAALRDRGRAGGVHRCRLRRLPRPARRACPTWNVRCWPRNIGALRRRAGGGRGRRGPLSCRRRRPGGGDRLRAAAGDDHDRCRHRRRRPGDPSPPTARTSPPSCRCSTTSSSELDRCDRRAHLRIVNQRCAAVPIEPLACLARLDARRPHDVGHVPGPASPAQLPCDWLDIAADAVPCDRPRRRRRVRVQDRVVPGAVRRAGDVASWLRRPVKFAQTRSESMLQMSPGRDQEHEIDVGFDRDGKIKALRRSSTPEPRRLPRPHRPRPAVLTTWMAAGAYRIADVQTSFRTVITNTTPVAAYRGAGRPEAAFSIERIVDLVAARAPGSTRPRCGAATSSRRRRSRTPPTTTRWCTTRPTSRPRSTSACACSTTTRVRAEQAARRDDLDPAAARASACRAGSRSPGSGPNGSLEGFGHLGSWESAQVRIQPDGSAIIFAGIVAARPGSRDGRSPRSRRDELGISFDRIAVRTGDTATVLQGIGTMGSRGVPDERRRR